MRENSEKMRWYLLVCLFFCCFLLFLSFSLSPQSIPKPPFPHKQVTLLFSLWNNSHVSINNKMIFIGIHKRDFTFRIKELGN